MEEKKEWIDEMERSRPTHCEPKSLDRFVVTKFQSTRSPLVRNPHFSARVTNLPRKDSSVSRYLLVASYLLELSLDN